MGIIPTLRDIDVQHYNKKVEPNRVYINSYKARAMGEIGFSFNDSRLEHELHQLIGDNPSDIRISTRLYEIETLQDDLVVAYSAEYNLPLIVYRNGSIILNFDLTMARQVAYEDSKRPLYTYVPLLNIRTIPTIIRRPISNLLASKQHAFCVLEDALAYYRRLNLNSNDFITILLNKVIRRYLKINMPIYQWPEKKRSVFISLHDVDSNGLINRKKKDPLLSLENKHGIRATWFVLTSALKPVSRDQLTFLIEDGHEVGWHGYNHDHRLPFGRYTRERIKHLNRSVLVDDSNYPLGMRTPKLLKSKHLYRSLERYCPAMCYDTSFLKGIAPHYLSTGSVNHTILEIPTTIPTDIRLYNELANLPKNQRFEAILKVQIERTSKLIEAGGLLSIVTHPEPDLTERPELLEIYDHYLNYLRSRNDIWFTTAGSLYKYWKENEQYSNHTKQSA